MKTINQLIGIASQAGFEQYGSFNEVELQHEILTCTRGDYSGEVIDIYYDWESGRLNRIEYSAQFKGQEPKFRFS